MFANTNEMTMEQLLDYSIKCGKKMNDSVMTIVIGFPLALIAVLILCLSGIVYMLPSWFAITVLCGFVAFVIIVLGYFGYYVMRKEDCKWSIKEKQMLG